MATKIKFDSSGNPESPTLVLMTRSGKKIGLINYNSLIAHISLQNPSEISFRVNKYYNGVLNNIWVDIVDLKLVWCVEYDIIYQISVEVDEEDDTTKIISGVKLSQSELSQIMLYDYQINTEDDIAREDYKAPTVFYNKTNKDVSLLDRMLEKAPHYTIIHVDSTLCNIQRTFSFDNVSLYDALKQVEDEIGCIFTFPKEGGTAKIRRQIAVFDMWSNCIDCGYRGDFTDVCPKCGSKQIISGYGQDTGVFVTSDELADQISIKADVDSVKNCLKLEAGDDLMTATIKNCNPNGSSYIWNITGDMKKDMTEELVQKIDDYDTLYNKYNNEKEYYIKVNTLSGYNNVVSKYNAYKNRFSEVSSPIIGFPNIINTKYDVIDLGLFIQTELMPDASLDDTSAEEQVQLLTTEKIGTISVSNIKALSLSSANSAVLGYCKCVIDNRYTTEIIDSSIDDSNHWIGTLKVANNSDENDTANTSELIIQIDDNYEMYVRQKVDKVFAKHNIDNVSIAGIFKLELEEFKSEMKKYSIDMLTDFHDACQAGIDILVEQGVGTKETWAGEKPNLYDDLYIPYYNKLMALEDELKEKENDLSAVKLMERAIDTYISKTHEALDFEKYLGEDLWLEFCCYRRDDKYTNQNYVSDGLSNKELFEKAIEFYECAKKEISQSAELQFSISATLNNLLVIDKFKPLLNDFTIGNWIRVEADGKIYKLRLLDYEIDYDNLEILNVEFSNVLRSSYGISDQQSIISAVQSMATSYEYTQHQASKGEKGDNVVKDWKQNGLDATATQIMGGSDYQNQTWDSHGILLRKYDSIEDKYEDEQMKIVNSTIAITNDNWETVKTAIGYYFYTDSDGELKSTYGINAETIVGKLVLGNELYFSNENNTMTFDKNGLSISNGINSFIVNPDDKNLLKIKNGDKDVFYVDQDGELHITGDGTYVDVSKNETISGIKTDISSLQELAHSHNNKSILDKIEQPYTTAERDKLAGLENYVHPSHTAHSKDMYKIAVDDEGHVTDAETVTKEDITALGIPGENTTYEITRKGNRIFLEGSDKSSSSAMTNDYVTHGTEKSYDVDPYKSYLIFYQRKPDDATSLAPFLVSSEDIWVSMHHDGIGVAGTITAGHFSGADATTSQQGLMSAADKKKLDGMDLSKYLPKDGTAVAAAKLSTARKINTIAFDGTADIVIPRSTKCMNASSGTGGQTGYVKVATFTVKSQYTNMPTVVRYRNRHTMPVELIFRFKNQSRVDPELEFILQVVELTNYGYKEAYLYKSAASTWDLMIAKSEAWDSVQILDCQQADGVSVTFENTHVSTVPSTAIRATEYTRAMVTSTVAAANQLAKARTLTVGNTGKTFDGSANVSWSLDEIGVLGRNTKGKTYKINNVSYNGSATDYIFNDYTNQAGGGEYITVTGSQNIALGGNCIFLAGWRNTAQGHQCAAMGQENIVAGTANIALGSGNQVTADAQGGLALGNLNTCKANASLSGGWYTEVQAASNQSIGYGNHVTVATASCAAFGAYNGYGFAGPYLILGNGTGSARANAFRAAAAGVYSSGSYHSSGADYAEYFEWLDGNPHGEDRRGRFVRLDGEKILLAESIEDDILGIVSGNPSVVGDSYEDQWQGQYLTDIYGELLTEDYTDEDGTTRKVWVLNPDYNPDKPYVPRSERQEWSAVGMMGKLIVIDDGTCRPNDYCVPTTGGIATRSEGRVGYRVLSRIDDTHIKVLIKG